jgi:hypothetical protein
VLDFLGELLVELLSAAIPPRAAAFLTSLIFYLTAFVCFGAGLWIAYRAITEPAERAYLGLTLLAWFIGVVFWLIADKVRKA